jgi:hypothetical protein
MAIVIVPLDSDTIQGRMQDMRTWLDSRRIQPDLFTYHIETRGPIAKVGFAERRHAEAFATEFAGSLI